MIKKALELTAGYLTDIKTIAFRSRKIKELAIIITGNVLALGGSILAVKLLTSWMEPELYGEIGLLLTICGFISCLFFGPVGQAISRYYLRYDSNNSLSRFFKAVIIYFIVGISFSLIVWVFWGIRETFLGKNEPRVIISLIILGLIFTLFSTTSSWLNGVLAIRRQRKSVALLQGISSWLRCGLAVLLFVLFSVSVPWCISGYCLSLIILTSVAIKCLGFKALGCTPGWSKQNVQNEIKLIAKYAWPYLIFGLFGWFQSSADRWIIDFNFSRDKLGYYILATQLGAIAPLFLSSSLLSLVAPYVFKDFDSKEDKQRNCFIWLRRCIALYLSGCIVFAVFVVIFGKQLVGIVADPSYAKAASLWPYTLLVHTTFFLGQILALTCSVNEKPKFLIPGKIVGGLVSVVAAFLGARTLGINGVILGMFSGAFVYMCMVTYAGFKANQY